MPTGIYKRTKPSANIGKHNSLETEFKNGAIPPKTAFQKGHIPWSKGKKIGLIPWNFGKKTGIKPWLGKKRPEISGENHPHWKGGITKENQKIRHSLEYKIWCKAVLERDHYTCIWCGQYGGHLEADHIKEFCNYPELRFAIDNGRTLCHNCHKKVTRIQMKSIWKNQYGL